MLKVSKINIPRMTHVDAYGFMDGVRQALVESFSVIPEYGKLFMTAMDGFDLAMSQSGESITGKEIAQLDANVDAIWASMRTHLKANVNHPRADISKAALTCQDAFLTYSDPTREPYATQYPIMKRLIASLEAIDADTLKACGLDSWLEALKDAVSSFITLYELRTDEQAKKVLGVIKAARQQTVDAYKTIEQAAQVSLVVSPTPEAEAFVQNLNTRINTYQAILKARKTAATKKDSSSNEVL